MLPVGSEWMPASLACHAAGVNGEAVREYPSVDVSATPGWAGTASLPDPLRSRFAYLLYHEAHGKSPLTVPYG